MYGGNVMFKVAICDDCPKFLSHLEQAIIQWEEKPHDLRVEGFTNGDALIASHMASPFDVIFLDMIMPLLNGIEAAQEIRAFDQNVKIIFLTSSAEYAVESYKVKAWNYLLKPVESQILHQHLNALLKEQNESARSILVKCKSIVHRVELSRIECLEAQNKHTLFALSDGTTIESIELMGHYEDKLTLSDGFFKCHRSYIVNLNLIDSYTNSEIRTHSGWRIPVSRRCHKEFEESYFTLLFQDAGETT